MYEIELNFSGHVFEVSWTGDDKQDIRSIGIIHSRVLCIISVAHPSAFPERVRIRSVISSLMNWDSTGAVLSIQYM